VETVSFEAPLEADEDGDGVFVQVPEEVAERISPRKRPPVVVTVNGVTYRTTFAIYGGRRILGFRRELRERAGLKAGNTATLEIRLDDQPRTVDLPADLAEALARNPEAARRFDALSYTHQKEHVESILAAKRPETRERRIQQAVERVSSD
jgi:hypothetical protein